VVLTTSDKHSVTHDGSVLVIRDVTVRDSGDYECLATNMAGTTRAVARLTVWGQSPRPPASMFRSFFFFGVWSDFNNLKATDQC